MRYLILVLILTTGFDSYGQGMESKYDLRFGFGTSILGTGDMRAVMFENEINMKLSKYLALGGGMSYGKSDNGVFESASFIQLNSNIYLSPFKNDQRNDFRFGMGVSWYSVSDASLAFARYQNGQLVNSEYNFDKRSSLGLNLILENAYSISEKFIVGLKAFTQPYQNGDINSGILLKLGVKLGDVR